MPVAGLINIAIKKANERIATGECISGTVEGDITVTITSNLMVIIDDICRSTRSMCHNALAATITEEEAPEENDDGEEDDEDEINEEVSKRDNAVGTCEVCLMIILKKLYILVILVYSWRQPL